MLRRGKVAIVQPYLAEYRRSFYRQLRASLDAAEISLELIHGHPSEAQGLRNDAIELDWASPVRSRRYTYRSRSIVHIPLKFRQRPDLIVVEQALANVAMWRALSSLRRLSGTRVALWGHGGISTRPALSIESALLNIATRRSDWFFAYTESAANFLTETGYPSQRITTIQNALDTDPLVHASLQVGPPTDEMGVLYLGGLDASKGIDNLLAMGRSLAQRHPRFVLHIMGDGADSGKVTNMARSNPWLRYHGRVADAHLKATVARSCKCMVLPGRVGLAVVEAFAMGLPVVARADWNHGPEFSYLTPEFNSLISRPGEAEIEHLIDRILTDEDLSTRLSTGALASAARYTLARMVKNFTDGVLRALRTASAVP